MRKPYSIPTVVAYGSIAECTFATPAISGGTGRNATAPSDGMGGWLCTNANTTGPGGGKNYIELQCDKFGEYSHASSAGS